MELRHLRYFIAVADELHFSRAANKLHMTQPPLSQQIRLLESELQMKLLNRTKRRVELTPVGRVFLGEARAIVAQADAAIGRTKRVQRGEVGSLSIGWMPWSDLTALPFVIRQFSERYPDVHLEVHNLPVSEQIAALHSGKIDVGFLLQPAASGAPPLAVGALQTEVVMKQKLVVVAPKNHKFASKKQVEFAQLANEPYILFKRESGPIFYDYVISLYQRHGLSLNVRHEADHPSTVVGLVAAGLGITILPFATNRIIPGVVYCYLSPNSASVETVLAWRPQNESALLSKFIDTVRKYRQRLGKISSFSARRLSSRAGSDPMLHAKHLREGVRG